MKISKENLLSVKLDSSWIKSLHQWGLQEKSIFIFATLLSVAHLKIETLYLKKKKLVGNT